MSRKITDGPTIAACAMDLLQEFYPGWTDEELVTHPREAMNLCDIVRQEMMRLTLEDHDILRALINARKRGQIKTLAKRRKPRAS